MKPIAIYDWKTRKRLAYLQNAHSINYTQQTNSVWTGSFSLPYSDEKKQYCQPLNFVELWDLDGGNNNKYVGLFRIVSIIEKSDSNSNEYTIEYILEHVMSTLLDSYIIGYKSYATNTVGYVINDILVNYQNQQQWVLGTCDYNDVFYYEFEDSNLLNVLNSIVKSLTEDYYWSFNTQIFPWVLNLKKVSSIPVTDIRYKKNIFGITKKIDPRSICTRLYLYGKEIEIKEEPPPIYDGASVNKRLSVIHEGQVDIFITSGLPQEEEPIIKEKINIKSINNGIEFLESMTGIQTYGLITGVINDDRFENPQYLYDYGVALLSKIDKPFITYEADIQAVYNSRNLKIGDSVRVVTEDGLDEILIIQEITKDDLTNSPNSGKITIGKGTIELGLIVKSFI